MHVSDETWFGIASFLLLTASFYLFTAVIPRTRRRRERAIAATGVVVGFYWGGYGGLAKIRYRDVHGREWTGRSPVAPRMKNNEVVDEMKLTVGQEVQVMYDPESPRWLLIRGYPDPIASFTHFGLFLAGFAALLLLMLLL